MKTPEEVLDTEFATQNLTGMVRDGVINAMKTYADQELASLREQKKKDDEEFNRALATIKELEKMYANTHGKLRDLEKEHSDNKANLHRAYKGLERLEELKKQLKQKEDENREMKSVLKELIPVAQQMVCDYLTEIPIGPDEELQATIEKAKNLSA